MSIRTGAPAAVIALMVLAAPVTAVAGPNTPPVAFEASDWTRRDMPLHIYLGGIDADGDQLTFAITEPPDRGDLQCSASLFECTYTPDPGYLGEDAFRWRVHDGTSPSPQVLFDITVYPNHPPVARSGSAAIGAGASASFILDADDEDLDVLTFSVLDGVDAGSLTCDPDYGECEYVPLDGFAGVDVFTWRASDGAAHSGVATTTLHVGVPPDDPPVVGDQSASTGSGVPLPIVLDAVDPEGAPLSYAVETGPADGSLDPVDCAAGSCTYTPDPGFTGTDSFTWRASDGTHASDLATFDITVGCLPFSRAISNGSPASTDGALRILVTGLGAFGHAVTRQGANYNPIGADAAALTVFSSHVYLGGSIGAFLSDCVGGSSLEVMSESSTSVTTRASFGQLEIGLRQTISPIGTSSSTLTQVYTLTNRGATPMSLPVVRHVDGDLAFDDTIHDGGAALANGSVVYQFDSTDDPAAPATFVGISGSLADDPTPDRWAIRRSPYRAAIAAAGGIPAADHGTVEGDHDADLVVDTPYDVTISQQWDVVSLAPGSSVTFATLTRFGTAAFAPGLAIDDVTAMEGDSGTNPFTFTVTLGTPPAAPVSVDWAVHDGTATVGDGDYVDASGRLTFQPGGALVQVVPVDVVGDRDIEPDETFSVTLSNASNADISDATGIGTIRNDDSLGGAPIANGDHETVAEASRTTFDVRENDGDPDADPVSIVGFGDPSTEGGDVDCSNGIDCAYAPAPGFVGTDSFTYTIGDGSGQTDTATVTVTVQACPDLTGALGDGGIVNGQTWVACSWASAHAARGSSLTGLFPPVGSSLALMTTGRAADADGPNDANGAGEDNRTHLRGAYDASILRLDLMIPPGSDCLALDVLFASEEYPESVGQPTGDGFVAELDGTTWTVSDDGVAAARNFAFDLDGEVISVSSSFLRPPRVRTSTGMQYDGASPHLTARTPITPGSHQLFLSLFDTVDGSLDSAALVDGLVAYDAGAEGCAAGLSQRPVAVDDDGLETAEDVGLVIDVLANDVDADGDPLSVIGVGNPPHGTATIEPDHTIMYLPDPGYGGFDSFMYTIADGRGGVDSATVSLAVGPVDDPPVVGAGPDKNGVEGAAVALVGTVSDPDSVPTASWTAAGGVNVDAGATCAFSAPTSAMTNVTCTDQGAWTLTLRATDGVNPPVTDSLVLSLSNANPVVSAGADRSTVVGVAVALEPATFTDAGANDTHTAQVAWGDGATVAGTVTQGAVSGSVSASRSYAAAGTYEVTVTVTDDDGGSHADSLTVTVGPAPAPALTIDKRADVSTVVGIGSPIDYTITARSSGNVPLTGVTVTDDLLAAPGQLSCLPAVPASLAVGASVVCTGTHRVTASDLGAGRVLNEACADASQIGPPVCDEVTVTVTGATTKVVDDRSSGFVRRGTGWRSSTSGFRKHSFWAAARKSGAKRKGEWKAALDAPGEYEVSVFVPRSNATTRKARYQVRSMAGLTTSIVNQSAVRGRWVALGTFSFWSEAVVKLNDRTREPPRRGRRVAFDAVRFVPLVPEGAAVEHVAPAVEPPADQGASPGREDPEEVEAEQQPETTPEPAPAALESAAEPAPALEPEPETTPEPAPAAVESTAEPAPALEPEPETTPEPKAEPEQKAAPEPEPKPEPEPPPNESPKADAGGPYEVDEGDTVRLDGRDSRDPDGSIETWSWTREKRLDDPSVPRPRFSAPDDGRFEIELTVTDDAGASDTDRAIVKVRNVDPNVSVEAGSATLVGERYPVDVGVEDVGVEDTHRVRVDWGDGTMDEIAVDQAGGAATASGSHVYAGPGTYTVTVTATDDDGGARAVQVEIWVVEPGG